MKDYYFDTSSANSQPCRDLFCPVYSAASSADPLIVAAFAGPPNDTQLFLAVGLDSALQAADVARKPLNLAISLDYSGSMGSPFDQYYYDAFGNRQQLRTQGAPEERHPVLACMGVS